MTISPLAGKSAPKELLGRFGAYYERHPDLEDPGQRVDFGTSARRVSPDTLAWREIPRF